MSLFAGATSVSYTTSATATSDSGSTFDVVVSNSAGSATSNSAMLTVNRVAVAPTITAQPANQTVTAGQTATFSVAASGTAPLNYQWSKNGTALSGATSASYTTPATSSSDNGALFNVAGSFSTNGTRLLHQQHLLRLEQLLSHIQEGSNSNIQYFADMYYGSSPNFTSSQLLQADPLFLHPPSLTQYGYSPPCLPGSLATTLLCNPAAPPSARASTPAPYPACLPPHRFRPEELHLHRHQRQTPPPGRRLRPRRLSTLGLTTLIYGVRGGDTCTSGATDGFIAHA